MNNEQKPFSLAGMTIAKKTNSKTGAVGAKKLKPYQLRANINKGMFQFSDSAYESLDLEHHGLTIAYDDQIVCLCIAPEADSKFYKHKGDSNKGRYFKSTALLDLLKERGLIVPDKKINYFSLSNEGIDGNFVIYEISNSEIEKDTNKIIGHAAASELKENIGEGQQESMNEPQMEKAQ